MIKQAKKPNWFHIHLLLADNRAMLFFAVLFIVNRLTALSFYTSAWASELERDGVCVLVFDSERAQRASKYRTVVSLTQNHNKKGKTYKN